MTLRFAPGQGTPPRMRRTDIALDHRPFMRGLSALAACLVLSGCPKVTLGPQAPSTSDEDASAAGCSALDGLFQVSYERRSGNCGQQPDEILQFVAGRLQSSFAASCDVGDEASVSSCDVELDRTCKLSDPSTGAFFATSKIKGTLSQIPADDSAEGNVDISLLDNGDSGACEGSYFITAVRTR